MGLKEVSMYTTSLDLPNDSFGPSVLVFMFEEGCFLSVGGGDTQTPKKINNRGKTIILWDRVMYFDQTNVMRVFGGQS